ncbi:ATP-binding cassette domain-containing protein, partial [Streptomyces sp. HSW2009]|uniref:ATP-binding cassette domain-containing protein n=1 Tax=Streptomyces sp. HSW2009 TaxID=3142890 RepID=UPI0032EF407B
MSDGTRPAPGPTPPPRRRDTAPPAGDRDTNDGSSSTRARTGGSASTGAGNSLGTATSASSSTVRPYAAGLRFLGRRWRVLGRLAGWSVLEAGQTFLTGYALARALDDGFLAGERGTGLGWLALAALAVVVGAYGTGRVYREVAALVEPLRDGLARRVVDRAVRDAVGGGAGAGESTAVSRLTHQVEIARETFAGLVMVARSFVFVAAGALVGLFSLAPVLLLVVLPPLLLGLALFLASLRPMARRQETFLVADEAIAAELGRAAAGLRDITAAGAEERVAAEAEVRIAAEAAAACSLARWGMVREAALGIGGRLPVVLLLVATPWLLDRGVTAGALVGALTYLTQSLLPALQALIQGVGLSGSRLAVVIRRLTDPDPDPDPDWPSAQDPEAAPAPHVEAAQARDSRAAPYPNPEAASAPNAEAAPAAAGPTARQASPVGHDGAAGAGPEAAPGRSAAGPVRRGGRGTVALRGVTFAYGAHAEPVVRGLDLDVPAGGWLAVVGPSGIGKSTLAGLIAGLLEPRAGEVALGGVPVAGQGPAERAAARVLIPQEAYVFTGTVADNLGYLRAGPVPAPELWAAVAAIGLGPLVDRLGGLTGEVRPAALSAGERQQVALARAYLSPAPVALLDEATCHLDPAAEARAEQAFADRPGGTLIVIAHRISSARRADRVLVMDGRHTASGSHHELLTTSPLYRDLAGDWAPSRTPAAPPSGPAAPLPGPAAPPAVRAAEPPVPPAP